MRREYAGAAPKARLAAPLGGTALDLGILGDDLTGWPTGTEPFFIVIDRGLSTEEKILCELRSSNSLTVYTDGVINGRGADGTAISAHSAGAYLEHVFTATDADEANEHVNSTANVHGVISDVVGEDDVQTLTNKSISGNANTLTNIAQASVTGLVSKLAALDAEDVDLQNQIDALEAGKADSASPTFTGTVVLPADTSIGNVSATEIGYVDGATANIQTQLNAKAPIDSPTFTGTPVLPAETQIGGVTISEITGGGLAVPAGGAEGWILVKKSAADYDMEWQDPAIYLYQPGSSEDLIYADGAISTTNSSSTGTYSVGATEYRWLKFTDTSDIIFIDANEPVIGKILLVGGGGRGGSGGGANDYGGGGGAGAVYYGDYAFGTGQHNIKIGAGGAATLAERDTWIDQDTFEGSGGLYGRGGGNGGNTGGNGGTGGCGGARGDDGGVAGTSVGGSGGNPALWHYGNPTSGSYTGSGGSAAFTSTIDNTSVVYGQGGGEPSPGGNGASPTTPGSGGGGGTYFYQPGGAGVDGIIIVRYRIA